MPENVTGFQALENPQKPLKNIARRDIIPELLPTKKPEEPIILSQRVHNYEPGRQGTDKFVSRGETIECSPLLLNRAREVRASWKGAPVHTGLLVSGEKLVDSAEFRAELLKRQPEALGGDMEAAGVVTAAESRKKDWLICKAIADWGEGKVDGDQVRVAQTAIEFALMIVERIK